MGYRQGRAQIPDSSLELAHKLATGQTERQKQAAFAQKLLIGGGMAALTGIGGLAAGAHSKSLQDKQALKRAVTQDEASKKKAEASREAMHAYAMPSAKLDQSAAVSNTPAWLSEHDYGGSIKDKAKSALGDMSVNSSAQDAKLGGYSTMTGSLKLDQAAGSQSRDINTAQDLMKSSVGDTGGGGMMGSLPMTEEPGIDEEWSKG